MSPSSPRSPLLRKFVDASAGVMRRHFANARRSGAGSLAAVALMGSLAVGCADPTHDQLPADQMVKVEVHEGGTVVSDGGRFEGRLVEPLHAPDGTLLADSGSSVLLSAHVPTDAAGGGVRVRLEGIESPEIHTGGVLARLFRPRREAEPVETGWETSRTAPQDDHFLSAGLSRDSLEKSRGSLARALGLIEDNEAQHQYVNLPDADTLRLPVGKGVRYESAERKAEWEASLPGPRPRR